ncbi:acetyltransferase (GNAT) family protein [Algoriphagus boseongensis]|uniref:Acetyltransferase (GNAT) family protein n=1 Tax=Algoriphagus boseongensis TaxID=1442587 RepID=A0A4R6T9Y7_9BACT|nr:GNAT family N-acetyltransferase [Algoriphagus boseongensis]TDQ19556.1 acetyltransferase (GNAT) family protein [Algoriphagus boseongensis]
MEIRKAQAEDIPKIVDLLKKSLGESLIPKSEKLWNWKHLENPFGASPTLLAEEKGDLLGLRTFLKWEFETQGKVIHACRAVDTAVHPDFQGKGIFTQLTKSMLEEIRKDGIQLIFNTPNEQSTPGYIKMGWEKYAKLPLFLGINPRLKSESKIDKTDWGSLTELISQIESNKSESAKLSTHIKKGYIQWRYSNCPLFPYYALSDKKSFLLIFRIKEGKWANEFRICELFTLPEFGQKEQNQLQEELNDAISLSGCSLISYSGMKDNRALALNFLPKLSVGPLVTLRKVNHELEPMLMNWSWSIGDLEVF